MNDPDTRSQLIWAYLHGELSTEDRVRLLYAAKEDPELQKLLDETGRDHHYLREVAPWMARSDADLDQAALAAWEKEQHPAPAPSTPAAGDESPGWFAGWGRWPITAAAMAVLVMVSFSIFWLYLASRPMDVILKEITWIAPAVRAAPGEAATIGPEQRAELEERFKRALQNAVRAEQRQVTSPVRRPWSLSARIDTESDGALIVSVTAEPRAGIGTQGPWRQRFADADSFTQTIGDFAAQIARDLLAAGAGREDKAPPGDGVK